MSSTAWPIIVPLVVLIGPAIQCCIALVGRSRGREMPWTIHLMFEPPRFVDERLNRIESFLVVVVIPVALLCAPIAILVGAADHYTLMYALLGACVVLLNTWPIFVSCCLAFAELPDEPAAAVGA
jgi:hypothetical protein